MPGSAPAVSAPTHFYVPHGSIFTIADEVADLMAAVGYQIDEPERMVCRALFPQRPNGEWVGLDSGIVCPRQNLKTATMIGGALHDTFVQGVNVAWTAHEYKTSSEALRDFQALIEGHDWLASEVLAVRTANGKEGFDLRNGARLDILARTGRSGRGMARPRLYLDEGLYLDGKMMGAIVPTMSAMPNAHMVVGSSPGLPTSGILRGMRDRGRSGTDPHIGWIEWSQERTPCVDTQCTHQPGTPGCWLDDLEAVLRVNPAAGRRISLDYLAQERLALASAPVEYLRERMGVWEEPLGNGEGTLFPSEDFASLTDEESHIPDGGLLVFAVDVSWDRSLAHIAVAGLREDGLSHVQVVAVLDPSDVRGWLTSRVRRFAPLAVALQGNGAPVSSLGPELSADGLPVHLLNGADMARATGSMFDAIKAGRIRHLGEPALQQQVSTALARQIGDGVVIDRKKSPIDVSGLTAVTAALWVLDLLTGSAGYDVEASIH